MKLVIYNLHLLFLLHVFGSGHCECFCQVSVTLSLCDSGVIIRISHQFHIFDIWLKTTICYRAPHIASQGNLVNAFHVNEGAFDFKRPERKPTWTRVASAELTQAIGLLQLIIWLFWLLLYDCVFTLTLTFVCLPNSCLVSSFTSRAAATAPGVAHVTCRPQEHTGSWELTLISEHSPTGGWIGGGAPLYVYMRRRRKQTKQGFNSVTIFFPVCFMLIAPFTSTFDSYEVLLFG